MMIYVLLMGGPESGRVLKINKMIDYVEVPCQSDPFPGDINKVYDVPGSGLVPGGVILFKSRNPMKASALRLSYLYERVEKKINGKIVFEYQGKIHS